MDNTMALDNVQIHLTELIEPTEQPVLVRGRVAVQMEIRVGTRKALVIGIEKYAHLPDLPNAVSDAVRLKSTLQQLGWSVESLLNPGRTAMMDEIQNFAQKVQESNDACLLGFTGHGAEFQDQHFLLPADFCLEDHYVSPKLLQKDIESKAVSLTDIEEHFMAVRPAPTSSQATLLVLDCCRGGLSVRVGVNARAVSSPLDDPHARKIATCLLNSCILFSTMKGRFAKDGAIGHGGPFMAAFTDEIRVPGATMQDVDINTRNRVWQQEPGQVVEFVSKLTSILRFSEQGSRQPGTIPKSDGADADALATLLSSWGFHTEEDVAVLSKLGVKNVRDLEFVEKEDVLNCMDMPAVVKRKLLKGLTELAAFPQNGAAQAEETSSSVVHPQAMAAALMDEQGEILCDLEPVDPAMQNLAGSPAVASRYESPKPTEEVLEAMRQAKSAADLEQACCDVRILAADHDNHTAIADLGGAELLRMLLEAMQNHRPVARIQEQVCWALSSLAASSSMLRAIQGLGGFETVRTAMRDHIFVGGVQVAGCRAVGVMPSSGTFKDNLECVLQAMSNNQDNIEVQVQACKTLTTFLLSGQTMEDNDFEISARAVLSTLWKHFGVVDVQLAALEVLANFVDTRHASTLDVTCPQGHKVQSCGTSSRWVCDGRHTAQGCSRQSAGDSLRGVERWSCCPCGYNLCDRCYSDAAQAPFQLWDTFASLGPIEAVLEALRKHRGDQRIQEQACRAFGNFAFYSYSNPESIEAAVLVVMQEHRDVASLQQAACDVLSNRTLRIGVSGIKLVLEVMRVHSAVAGVQQAACAALSRVAAAATNQSDAADVTGEFSEAVRLVLAAMTEHRDVAALQVAACETLRNVALLNPHIMDGTGSIAAILVVMSEHKLVPGVQEQACKTLSNLASTMGDRTLILSSQGVETIVMAMQQFEAVAGVQKAACEVLSHLAAVDRDRDFRKTLQTKIRTCFVISCVLGAMERHPAVAEVQLAACRALGVCASYQPSKHFCSCASYQSFTVTSYHWWGMEALARAMTLHQHIEGIQEEACKATHVLVTNCPPAAFWPGRNDDLEDCLEALKRALVRFPENSAIQVQGRRTREHRELSMWQLTEFFFSSLFSIMALLLCLGFTAGLGFSEPTIHSRSGALADTISTATLDLQDANRTTIRVLIGFHGQLVSVSASNVTASFTLRTQFSEKSCTEAYCGGCLAAGSGFVAFQSVAVFEVVCQIILFLCCRDRPAFNQFSVLRLLGVAIVFAGGIGCMILFSAGCVKQLPDTVTACNQPQGICANTGAINWRTTTGTFGFVLFSIIWEGLRMLAIMVHTLPCCAGVALRLLGNAA